VAEALEGLLALGFVGANVTMPHKTEVAARVATRSEDAERLAAVNTVVVGEDELAGHNTDAPGFERFLRHDAMFDAAGRTGLLYGVGGAARACALALARAGLAQLRVAARDPGRVGPLAGAVEGLGMDVAPVAFEDAAEEPVDLVVNATPLGARGESLPTPPLGPGVLVVDLLYDPIRTPLVDAARTAGASAHGGLGLLLHQAALSLELWTGQVPSLEVMSAAATAVLAERA
jgi:shikimate dehydrogenase